MRIFVPLWVGVCFCLWVGGCEKSPPDTSTTPRAGPEATTRSASPERPDVRPQVSAVRNNWSGFRGNNGRGSADGQNLPDSWSVEPRKNIRWRTLIRGLGHSSPIVWGDSVFVAAAVKTNAHPRRETSDDGTRESAEDRSTHQFVLTCVNASNGAVLWRKIACEAVPKTSRHPAGTYSNFTPVTNGRQVCVLFGSDGLYMYDVEGRLLWEKDVGSFQVGSPEDPAYPWGAASSPVMFRNLVILQCDIGEESCLAAYDIRSGRTAWKKPRVEAPAWSTPLLYQRGRQAELVVNGWEYIRSFDPVNGNELWRAKGGDRVVGPSPTFLDDLIVVAGGTDDRLLSVIRAGAKGDVTPGAGGRSALVWQKKGIGPQMPTPLAYRGHLYVCSNEGVLGCYDLETGSEFYRVPLSNEADRVVASPIAADGKIYVATRKGLVFVIRAGPNFEVISKNDMGAEITATPAISAGMMYLRTRTHLIAVGA